MIPFQVGDRVVTKTRMQFVVARFTKKMVGCRTFASTGAPWPKYYVERMCYHTQIRFWTPADGEWKGPQK